MVFEVFDGLWRVYDGWYVRNAVTAENEVRAVSLALSGVPRPWAEVGVGTGFFAWRLGVEYGVDPAVNALALARERGVEVVAGVGEVLPFRDSVFGGVLLIVTLCFVDDPAAVMREAGRVLRSGGYVVACVVPRESAWGRYYEGLRGVSPFYSVARFLTAREVEALAEGAGLEPVGWVSTLTYGPLDEPRPEKPFEGLGGGFSCLRARK